MSNSSITNDLPSRIGDVDSVRAGARLITAPLRFVGFWAAVALPFVYLPLLVGGIAGEEAVAFAGLVALHAVALLIGHNYGQ
jgi:hypothetical protein